jgi:hypothetical protein
MYGFFERNTSVPLSSTGGQEQIQPKLGLLKLGHQPHAYR